MVRAALVGVSPIALGNLASEAIKHSVPGQAAIHTGTAWVDAAYQFLVANQATIEGFLALTNDPAAWLAAALLNLRNRLQRRN